jgi:hypothetical protein
MSWEKGGEPTLSPEERAKAERYISSVVDNFRNIFKFTPGDKKPRVISEPTPEEVVIMEKMNKGSGCKEKGCGCGKPGCRNCCVFPFVGTAAAVIGALSLPAAIETVKMISVILSH